MNSNLRFSVVTAIKDGFSDFKKTIPTVLHQTYSDFEWLIIDDGSSESVSKAFPELAKDSRVKVIRPNAGMGQTAALNLGIHESKGPWIIRMDGDDLCHPARFDAIHSAIALNPAAHLIFSDFRILDESDRIWAEVHLRAPLAPSFFRYLKGRNNPVCHPTVAFRKLDSSGALRLYREDLINAQDYALWKEILEKEGAKTFVHLPTATIDYRVVRNSLSGAKAPEQREELKAIRKEKTLHGVVRSSATLSELQKDAMQSYRILFFRFVGMPSPAPFRDDLEFLASTRHSPQLFLRALFFLFLRPMRKILLRFLFSGIYK